MSYVCTIKINKEMKNNITIHIGTIGRIECQRHSTVGVLFKI